ncbi:MAG: PEP-utilizing enzyme [bacterium]|nr:PEP-utilizing enzyme [bacterium]
MNKILLKGTPASLGVIKGKVKILHDPSDSHIIKKGDILVVEMTDPLYMHAMMRAGGVITNIGGVLSHAAIISRELRIPCIVGTGNATEILTNDQLIILDATKGNILSCL